MASKMARYGPTWFNIANDMLPRGSKTTSRRLHEAKEPPKEALERPKSFKNLEKTNVFLHSRFFASDGLLKPRDGSKMAQNGPKRGPKEAQDGPKSAQERPKTAPRGPQEAIFRAPMGGGRNRNPRLFCSMASKMAPERPKRGPRGPQDGPKSAQESPKSAPRGPEERPKRVPEASNMSSRGPYDGPKRPIRRSQLSILTALR